MATIFVRNILSEELTAVPTWIRTICKERYNNALCNGATWVLILWRILHILYNKLMNTYLKKIRTKQYIRARLTHSLWYCGFFSSTLAYCILTFDGYKMDLLRGYMTSNENLSTQAIVAHTVICTFYLHTALLEGIHGGSVHMFLKYVLLVAVCTFAYILRFVTVPLTLSALLAISTISEELTKIFYSLLHQDKFVGSLYLFNLVLFTFVHLMIIPLIILMPMGKMIASNTDDTILILLFTSLLFWLSFSIYRSIISNSIYHWIYHTSEELTQEDKQEDSEEIKRIVYKCPGNMIECSLFSGRTDDAYILRILRSQVKERKNEMDALKKPKSKNMMLIQTLKCMMAIRKKLNQKRKSDSSDSDEHSENEEDAENNKVGVYKVLEADEAKPKSETENTENDIMVIEESELLIATIDMENDEIDKINIETINDNSSPLKSLEDNVPSESLSHSETKVDIIESTKDDGETRNEILCKARSVESFESCSNVAYDSEKVKNSKIPCDLVCVTKNLGNIESGKLLCEDEEGQSTKIVSDILGDIVDNKLNIETELKEPIKVDETSLLLDEERNREGGEVTEEKDNVILLTSFKTRTDGDE